MTLCPTHVLVLAFVDPKSNAVAFMASLPPGSQLGDPVPTVILASGGSRVRSASTIPTTVMFANKI
jgi:hypothetical protein